jgi:hypothetical protein
MLHHGESDVFVAGVMPTHDSRAHKNGRADCGAAGPAGEASDTWPANALHGRVGDCRMARTNMWHGNGRRAYHEDAEEYDREGLIRTRRPDTELISMAPGKDGALTSCGSYKGMRSGS